MRKIRVLVVDDAVAVRRLLARMLSSDPKIEVSGTAANGRIALDKLPQLAPDVVVLDVEMPELDGLRTLERIRQTHPRMPVIMFSSHTVRGAAATIEALSLGATDYVTKPSTLGDSAGLEEIRESLIRKVIAVAGSKIGLELDGVAKPAKPRRRLDRATVARVRPVPQVVAIGASTGGPNALVAILADLPASFSAPVLIVQHMPPLFTQLLAQRLDAQSQLHVCEAVAGAPVAPGSVWVAPGDWHMVVERVGDQVVISTNQEPAENSCRPSVDVLFRSVAEVYGGRSLAIVLTGMGRDGLRGCEAIYEAGGQVLAQDEESSVVWGMPGFIANAGIADMVLPADGFSQEILRRVRPNGSGSSKSGMSGAPARMRTQCK